ncbi:hypothetical protein ORV05_30300 [Amycolatopsis cynarae]|uniref:Mce-associated membrane protein n=1 Tax=Amycolatopsis cynarae TaxID=2995223 RepID=A0ABY7B0E7_9PSEU|nr:hypothetical protein [Amycolatopsis sp. HUAS 11-8]WAL65163.1 hypothetical protein ORV05_30300 [Amycolatopsis sp. HUAS 11-8]
MSSDEAREETPAVETPETTQVAGLDAEAAEKDQDEVDSREADEADPGEPDEDQSEDLIEDLIEERSEEDPRLGRFLLLGSAGLAAAALIVAAVFGIQWWVASSDDNLPLAQARDEVVREAGIAVRAYTEMDYRNLDAFFQKQIDVSAPEMQNQIKNIEQTYRQAMTDAKTQVTTTVQEVGVEELNEHEGKASLLAAISTLVTKEGQQQVAKPLRLEVQMTRVGQDWKVSSIGSVPVVTGGQ